MTSSSQKKTGIRLVLTLPIVGLLRFITSIVLFVVDITGIIETKVTKHIEYDSNSITTWYQNNDPLNEQLVPQVITTEKEGYTIFKNFVNRILGIIALLGIPGTIAGIVLLATNKKEEEENQGIQTQESRGTDYSNDTIQQEYIYTQTQTYTGKIYKDNFSDILTLGRDAIFTRTGRISRGEYFMGGVTSTIGLVIILSIDYLLMGTSVESFATGIQGIYTLVMLIILVILITRRFGDLDRHWTHIFFILIPFYNIYIRFILWANEGTSGPNRFGNNTLTYQPETNRRYWIIYILVTILYAGLLLGEIIEAYNTIDFFVDEGGIR